MSEKKKPIYVTQPALPPLDKFVTYLEDIWESKWLTNNGKYHKRFEQALCDYLGVENCCLFANGTLALIVGLQALRITGEVITTPYSFVASTHALHWNGIQPVFGDIDPETFNLDPDKIEALITPKTTAILPVHVYGNPCDQEKIARIADIYGLKVIYDAAHAFGVQVGGKSVLEHGDLSILSFHATKMFNTMEGGAIVTRDKKLKERIDYLKNFGFANEVTVVAPGINAKMNELQAAFGLLQLEIVDEEIRKRKELCRFYTERLEGVEGLTISYDMDNVTHSYPYYPVLIDGNRFHKTRDKVYDEYRTHDIYARRYFYPLISSFPTYRGLPSAQPGNLPVAERVAQQVLCLPLYGNLSKEDAQRIVDILLS